MIVRGGAPQRVLTALLLVACVSAITIAVAVGSAGRASAQSCGPAAAGRVAVQVVVDNGAASPSQRCVQVGERSTGYDVLVAAGHTLRIDSGFLCAIDGVPATGCGNRADFGGSYWRYFHAVPGGDWVYATVGGGGYRMPARCAIEGWRWATSDSADITPRVAPPQLTCEAPPVTAPPVTPAAPPPPPTPTPTPTPTAAPGVPSATAPATAATGGGAGSPGPGAAASGGTPDAGATTTVIDSAAGGDAQTSVPGEQVEGESVQRPDGATGAGEGVRDSPRGSDAERVAAAGVAPGDARTGSVSGLLIALLVIGALGGAARWRSRSRDITLSGASDAPSDALSAENLPEGP